VWGATLFVFGDFRGFFTSLDYAWPRLLQILSRKVAEMA